MALHRLVVCVVEHWVNHAHNSTECVVKLMIRLRDSTEFLWSTQHKRFDLVWVKLSSTTQSFTILDRYLSSFVLWLSWLRGGMTSTVLFLSTRLAQLVNAPTEMRVQSCTVEVQLHSRIESLTHASILPTSEKWEATFTQYYRMKCSMPCSALASIKRLGGCKTVSMELNLSAFAGFIQRKIALCKYSYNKVYIILGVDVPVDCHTAVLLLLSRRYKSWLFHSIISFLV